MAAAGRSTTYVLVFKSSSRMKRHGTLPELGLADAAYVKGLRECGTLRHLRRHSMRPPFAQTPQGDTQAAGHLQRDHIDPMSLGNMRSSAGAGCFRPQYVRV